MTKHIFIPKENHKLSRVAFFAAVLQFFVIFLDAYIRVTGSPDTFGSLLKECQFFLPIIVDVGIIFLIILAKRARHPLTYKVVFACSLLFLFALSKVLFTHFAKDLRLQSFIPLFNLLSNLAILSLLWWISTFTSPRPLFVSRGSHHPRYRAMSWIGLLLVFIQIMTSAVPQQLGVILASSYMLILSVMLISSRQLSEMGLLLLILLGSHFTLGMLSVVGQHSVWLILSYELSAIVLFLAIISLLIILYRKSNESW